jgi:hypothetical protein
MDTDKIKSLYAEFKGYLNEAPTIKERPAIHHEQIWEQYNNSVMRLSEISGSDYSNFLIKVERGEYDNFIITEVYRSKLGGLISKLHAEYFETSSEPFGSSRPTSGKQNIIISQTQHQSQQVFIQMILDVQSKIDEKLPTLQEGSKEKTFFQKLKGSLSATTGIIDLLSKMLILAEDCGISTDQLSKLFS